MSRVSLLRVATLALILAAGPAHASKSLSVVVFGDFTQSQNAQFRSMFDFVANLQEKETGFKWNREYKDEHPEFVKALASGKPDLVYSYQHNDIGIALEHGYVPMLGVKTFGSMFYEGCIYVHKKSPIKSVDELVGGPLMTYDEKVPYFFLRDWLGKDPAKIFKPLKSSPKGRSILVAVANKLVPAGFAQTGNEPFLKVTDPNTLKKVRRLACTKRGIYNSPFFMRKGLDPKALKNVKDYLLGLHKHPAVVKQYGPMLRMVKMSMVPFKDEWLNDFRAVDEAAKKGGWLKDFYSWQKLLTNK